MRDERFRGGLTRRAFALAGGVLSGAVALGMPLPAFAKQGTPVDLEKTGAYTIVVAGLDTRTVEEPENTDVLMLSRIDLWAGTVRTLSIPRDLHVHIPGEGEKKVNGAYDLGSKADDHSWDSGVALLTEMIEHNFQFKVDGVITTRFRGFEGVVDAFGGVTVYNPYRVFEDDYPTYDYGTMSIDFPEGELRLNGEEALQFCRTRHMDSDEARVMRQHLVLTALLREAQKPENIWYLPEIAEASREFVTTNLPKPVQDQLIAAVPYTYTVNVEWGTVVDYLWGYTTPSGGWIYEADWDVLRSHVQGWLGVDPLA